MTPRTIQLTILLLALSTVGLAKAEQSTDLASRFAAELSAGKTKEQVQQALAPLFASTPQKTLAGQLPKMDRLLKVLRLIKGKEPALLDALVRGEADSRLLGFTFERDRIRFANEGLNIELRVAAKGGGGLRVLAATLRGQCAAGAMSLTLAGRVPSVQLEPAGVPAKAAPAAPAPRLAAKTEAALPASPDAELGGAVFQRLAAKVDAGKRTSELARSLNPLLKGRSVDQLLGELPGAERLMRARRAVLAKLVKDNGPDGAAKIMREGKLRGKEEGVSFDGRRVRYRAGNLQISVEYDPGVTGAIRRVRVGAWGPRANHHVLTLDREGGAESMQLEGSSSAKRPAYRYLLGGQETRASHRSKDRWNWVKLKAGARRRASAPRGAR